MSGAVDRWTVECVCTDRGQHKRTWMARMIWDRPSTAQEIEDIQARARASNPDISRSDLDDIAARHARGGWRTFILGSEAPKHDMFGPPMRDAEPGSPVSRTAYGFACSRCTRWPKIERSRWTSLMDGARKAGIAEFDVSYLD